MRNTFKLNSDWFYQNGCVVISKNIVEYGLTYAFNVDTNKGTFYLINSTIAVPTYSDEKCRIANTIELEIADYMPSIYIKSYSKKVITNMIALSMTPKERARKNFMEKTDSEKFEYLYNLYNNSDISDVDMSFGR